jgi:energy-coupling factor transporter ATP-binding protein EcfA2
MTVIMGRNGSGKSHLLQAIMDGDIETNVLDPRDLQHISLITPDSIAYRDYRFFEPSFKKDNGDELIEEYKKLRGQIGYFTSKLIEFTGSTELRSMVSEDIWAIDPETLIDRCNLDRGVFSAIRREANEALWAVMENHGISRDLRQQIDKMKEIYGHEIVSVGVDDFRKILNKTATNPFSMAINQLFVSYRNKILDNYIELGRDTSRTTKNGLDQETFEARYGRAPWELLNEALRAFELPFEVNSPAMNYLEAFGVKLKHIDTQEDVDVGQLSAGEKVLFTFALATINIVDAEDLVITRPKILLLDEIDSPLHPGVTKRIIELVERVLVGDFGIKCIIATHSPTTVAMAPDSSLYEMRGAKGLCKISRREAINSLTIGIPTLSIDASGTRIVFVESDNDARIYGSIFSFIKPIIKSEKTLAFLPTGTSIKSVGTLNGGSSIVSSIVNSINSLGAMKVYGIVDWDNRNKEEQMVKVLAPALAYAIENVILNPLLLGVFLLKFQAMVPPEISGKYTFVDIGNLDDKELQVIANSIQDRVVSEEGRGKVVSFTCLNGRSFDVYEELAHMNGHSLEGLLKANFSFLSSSLCGRSLMQGVVKHVIGELPGLCPLAVCNLFTAIGNDPS